MNTPKDSTGGCCPPPPCYAVFIRKAGNWIQESVPFDSYADAQAHAKLTRRARPFVEITRVRRHAERYYKGTDTGNGDSAAWCVMKRYNKTGLLTVVECGTGEPPANAAGEPQPTCDSRKPLDYMEQLKAQSAVGSTRLLECGELAIIANGGGAPCSDDAKDARA
jgi:hypothetical protein